MESTFAEQVGVSAAGNLLTILVGVLIFILKEKCKKSHFKSKCHTGCCDVLVSDETIREVPLSRPPSQVDEERQSASESDNDPACRDLQSIRVCQA